jgi:hypothetical protein
MFFLGADYEGKDVSNQFDTVGSYFAGSLAWSG